MATFNKFQQFSEDLCKKVHNLATDQLTVALMAGAPDAAADAVLADITVIAYTNLSALNITTTSCEHTTGTTKLILADLVLTASGAVETFRYVVLYNNTPSSPLDPLIGWYDYGANVTLANGETFTVDFDPSAGVLTVA